MEILLQGISHVSVYIDNILITGESETDHLQILECMSSGAAGKGWPTCKFVVPSVDYIDYVIDAHGLRPHPDKVLAIHQAPKPSNVTQLKFYLGLLSYCGKFLSNLLVHFNPQLPLFLACDGSAYGIGAVQTHRMPDGSEQPIGYVSCTLNSAERNYSQLEKEELSCVFGIK